MLKFNGKLVLTLATILILTLSGAVLASQTLTVVLVGPMSGDYAIIGQQFVEGAQLAFDEINAQGGVNGITFRTVVYDDRLNPTEATNIARRVATDRNVIAVIGHYTSSAVFAAQGVYDQARIVHFTPSASHPDLTKTGQYTFRMWSTIENYQTIGARYAVEELGYKKHAIIYVNNDFGKGCYEVWRRNVEELGGEVVMVETILDGDRDFRAQLNKVVNSGADTLGIFTYYAEGALIVSQARTMGLDLPIMGTGTFYEQQFLDLAGSAAEGIIFNTEFHEDRPGETVQNFVSLFREKYPNKDMGSYHPTAFEAANLVIEAVRNVGANRVAIREYLVGLEAFEGVLGTYHFGEERNPEKTGVFVVIRDGKFELLDF